MKTESLLQSPSLFLHLSLSLSVISILFAAQRPHPLSVQLCPVILSASTGRVSPDAHLEMGWSCISDSIEMHLRMLILLWAAKVVGNVAAASIRMDAVVCFAPACSLESIWCDSKDNLRCYFLHAPVSCCAALPDKYLYSKYLWQLNFSKQKCVNAHDLQILTHGGVHWKSLDECVLEKCLNCNASMLHELKVLMCSHSRQDRYTPTEVLLGRVLSNDVTRSWPN